MEEEKTEAICIVRGRHSPLFSLKWVKLEGYKKFIIEYKDHVIATFTNKDDAEHFYNWKCEQLLFEQNAAILDEIAAKEGYDRKYPGLIPLSVSTKYYDAAKKKIAADCIMFEE